MQAPRLLAVVILAGILLGSSLSSPSQSIGAGAELEYLPEDLASSFVIAADALQCSLLDTVTHNNAAVLGQDGGQSYLHNGVVYWGWSDTFLSTPPSYIPNSAGTTSPAEAPKAPQAGAPATQTACFPMTYKTLGGAVATVLPAPAANCADWPTQLVSPDPVSDTLYFIYARNAPWVNATACDLAPGAGIGAFDTTSLTAKRLDNEPTWQEIPGQAVQISGGMPLRADDGDGEYIYLFLTASGDPDVLGSTTAVALARVLPSEFATPAQYRYYTGSTWVTWDDFKSMSVQDNGHFLWRQPDFGIQAGMKVSYLSHLRKWVAIYATNLSGQVRIRTADHLTGPWSRESRIIDCVDQLGSLPPHAGGPAAADFPCYSAMIHDELTSPDGLTVYVSFARNNWADGAGDYRVYLRRFNLASPISEWVDPAGRRTLVVGSTTGEGARQGLAFFESETPLPGYVPVYAFDAQPPLPPDRAYSAAPEPPANYVARGIAFYAPQTGTSPSIDHLLAPVHAVLLASGQHAYTLGAIPPDATDEGVAFNALRPNPDDDHDGVPDIVDNCPLSASADQMDTDRDGAGDVCDRDDDNDNVPDLRLTSAPFPFAPLDNCPTVANTDQADSDADGIGDACEASLYGTDPANPDTDADGCGDGAEVKLGLDPRDPWDFYSVPVPALFAAPDPTMVFADNVVTGADAQAVFAYYRKGATAGDVYYEQDLNKNGIKDGIEYDRSVGGPRHSGPPDGIVTAQDAQLALMRFRLGDTC